MWKASAGSSAVEICAGITKRTVKYLAAHKHQPLEALIEFKLSKNSGD